MNALLQTIIKTNLEGQFSGAELLPINICGQRGLGKSATVRQIAKDLKATICTVSIPSKDLSYFTGLPEFVDAPTLTQYSLSSSSTTKAAVWTASELIVNANHLADKHGRCVLFLDDLHKLTKSTSSVMYQLLLDKSVGDFRLHPKVAIICAQNTSEEAGFVGVESPINDRLSMMAVEYDHEYWMSHYGRKLHHFVSSFLKGNANFVLEPESTSVESAGSPRSWTYFSNSLELYDEQFIIDNSLFLAKQFISPEAAEAFQKHVLYISTIDFTSVVTSRRMQTVADLQFTEKILWPNIIQYVATAEDAAYIIDLVNLNMADDLFVGYVASELYIKYEQHTEGRAVTKAQEILIAKLLGSYDKANFELTEKESKLLTKTTFTEQPALLAKAAMFIL